MVLQVLISGSEQQSHFTPNPIKMIPQANATLVSVSRGGYTEDYDRPAGGATPAWQGNVEAYVQRQIMSGFNQDGELNRVLRTTLILDLSSTQLVGGLQAGDTVTCIVGNADNPSTLIGRVQNVVDPAYLPMIQDYFKCSLEEIQAQ